jgi:hypothetical protein
MTKSELRDRIKGLVKQVYKSSSNVDLDTMGGEISLEAEKFPILLRFPELKRVITDLLTNQYETFIKDIQWVAPKPTTFRIVLANNETFMLAWAIRSWICTVEGKKYYLLNLNEEENAVSSIARILSYGNTEIEDPAAPADTAVDTGGGDFPGGEGGGETETDTGGEETGGGEEVEVDVTTDVEA